MIEDLAIALIELLKENDKLRSALVEYVAARAEADRELAAWRRRRK